MDDDMKYFIKNSQRIKGKTAYFEFLPGRYRNRSWNRNSIYLAPELVDRSGMEAYIKGFDYYGVTEVEIQELYELGDRVTESDPLLSEIVNELLNWVYAMAEEPKCITIIGM